MITSLRHLILPGLLVLAACEDGGSSLRDPESTRVVEDAGGQADARPSLATLGGLEGTVQIERGGSTRAAREEPLFAGDIVQTGPDSQTEIRFEDGRTVEVGPSARVVLKVDGDGVALQVERGLVLSRVRAAVADALQKRTESGEAVVAIRILTPFGITRIGGGESAVSVQVDEAGGRVDVQVGMIELVGPEGEATSASAGQTVRIASGRVQVVETADVITLNPIPIEVVADGRVEIRKAGQKRWRVVGRDNAELAAGDSVRVARGRSSLALGGSQSRLLLDRGTELALLKTGRDDGRDLADVDLKRGALGLQLARDRRTQVALGGLLLEADEGGNFQVLKTRSGFEVSAITGDLRLRRGKQQPQVIPAGQMGRVRGTGDAAAVQVLDRSRPPLVLPSRTGLRVFHPGVDSATIDWRGGEGEYTVRVAEDPRFERMVIEGRVRASEVPVAIPQRGALYWEIKDVKGEAVESGSAFFAPEPKQRDLERLRNEVPEGPDKTTIYYQDKTPAVTFTYAAEPSAAKYQIRVFRVGELRKPVAERTVTNTSAPLEAGILPEGRYVWSVTPLSSKGEELRGGRMNKLDIVYDNSVPTLLVHNPRNGDRAGRQVSTRGVAPVGARLFINGKLVELDNKSRFDASVDPDGQPPMLIYRLVRPNAADALYVRTLKRSGG